MSDVPRRPLLQSVPAALVGTTLGSRVANATDDPAVADGGQPTAAAGVDPARTAVRTVTLEGTVDVPASDRDELALTAPPGSVLEVQALAVSVDPVEAANAGTHAVTIGPPGTDVRILRGAASSDEPLWFDGSTWRAAGEGATPPDATGQVLAARGCLVGDDAGLAVEYRNGTNATQTSPRTVEAWVVEHASPDETAEGDATTDV